MAATPAGHQYPTLLLDAGTGLSSVTRSLGGAAFEGDILLTHLHWDHLQGLPFFAAGDRVDSRVRLLLPTPSGTSPGRGSAAELLSGVMSPPYFPIGPDGLRGDWTFRTIRPGRFQAGAFEVTALEVPHKGGRTFGYRVEGDGASFAYLPDHDPSTDRAPGLRLADKVDVLCHGAMFTGEEQALAHAYGHSTVVEACRLATEARVGALVLIHHSPSKTDDHLDELERSLVGTGVRVIVGREGDVVLGADEGPKANSGAP